MNNFKLYFTFHPLPVTIASVFVLSITAWNGIRACIAIANWELLSRFDGNPAYIFATGLAWFVAGLALFIIVSNGERFALHTGTILSMIYIAWYWLDRLIIQASPAGNLAFSAVASMITFAIFNILLFWPSSRAFFTSARQT